MKTKILLLLTIVTFLTSCESNDDANINITSADLIGTWNLKQQSIENGSMTITSQGQTLTATYSALAKDIDLTYTFSENPNKLNLNGSYNLVATANFLGQSETEEEKIDTNLFPIEAIDWSLKGNTLTLIEDNDFPTVLNVVEFTDSYIKLVGELDETETDGGDSYNIKATLTVILEK